MREHPLGIVVTGQIILGRIDDFPGLGAVFTEADAIDHAGCSMVATAMILRGRKTVVVMTVMGSEQRLLDVIAEVHDGLKAHAQVMPRLQPAYDRVLAGAAI